MPQQSMPAAVPVLPDPTREYTVLPTKHDDQGNLVRSYPGDPAAIGWTVFDHNSKGYLYLGDPIYETEREAMQFLKEWRGVTIRLNWNPCEPRGRVA
ncbi:MAG: hypothetical protein L6461_21360 [Anaerolineae bacterium]|nr:hypothetical protein [Anaerolineae bacterium]